MSPLASTSKSPRSPFLQNSPIGRSRSQLNPPIKLVSLFPLDVDDLLLVIVELALKIMFGS